MGQKGNELLEEFAALFNEAILVANAGYCFTENLLFIPAPQWKGWKNIFDEGIVGHFARWEIFFPRGEEFWWVFLRITWPSVTQIVLGFTYPAENMLLEKILSQRRLVLIDLPLHGGQLNPLSRGIIVDDIPEDLPRMIGIEDGPVAIH